MKILPYYLVTGFALIYTKRRECLFSGLPFFTYMIYDFIILALRD